MGICAYVGLTFFKYLTIANTYKNVCLSYLNDKLF